MVIDTSALIAILDNEPDADLYEASLAEAAEPVISSATALECRIVLEHRYGAVGGAKLEQLLAEQGVQVVVFDREQYAIAAAAYRRFGRGRHPARLNFGDCFAYALAKHRNEPLLFKGNDFAATDAISAL
jgi:ribonuclease VapC